LLEAALEPLEKHEPDSVDATSAAALSGGASTTDLWWPELRFTFECLLRATCKNTIRKLINTNGNYRWNISVGIYTDGITVKKNLKQSKKKMTCHFYRRNIPSVKSLGDSVGKL
jgi:hypothetical protein